MLKGLYFTAVVFSFFFTHTGCIAAGMGMGIGIAFIYVCLFVHILKGKWLKLSKPNFVQVYSITVTWYALIQRSKVKVTLLRTPSQSHSC